jgi:hypothetical protein
MSKSDGKGIHGTPDEDTLERVRDALEERLAWNYGATLYVRAGNLKRDHDLAMPGQTVSAALRTLAGREGEYRVERQNPKAQSPLWMVREREREGSG